jgi:hypothetical protein
MSIDRKTFEDANELELEELSAPDHVLGFLGTHADRAFKAREIANQTGLDEGAVSTALSRLKERGLVEHKAEYWAVTTDEDRLEESNGYERATAILNQQLGEEDGSNWAEHAPEEPHPSVEDEQ